MGVGVRHRGAGHRPRASVDHLPRERRRGRGHLGRRGRRAARAHPAARQGQLLGDGRDRPVRPLQRDLLRPRPRARPRGRPRERGRRRPLRRDLEPGVHAVLPRRGRLAHRPADAQRRHRRRHGAHPGGPGGQRRRCTPPTCSSVLVDQAQVVTGRRLGESALGDIALRLLADHTRTSTFLVADGVVPSNEDRGYVLRRVIRRAVRFAYMLDVEQLVMPPMVERCIEIMGGAYPELVEQRELGARPDHPRGGARSARPSPVAPRCSTPSWTRCPRVVVSTARSRSSCTTPSASRSRSPRRWPTCAASRSTSTGSTTAMARQRERSRAAGRRTGVAAGDDVRRGACAAGGARTDRVHRSRGARVLRHRARGARRCGVPGPDAVLRRVRRSGRRHRHDHDPHRHRAGGRHHRGPPRPAPARRRGRRGHRRARPAGDGIGRRRTPRCHPPEPHRDPRPALGPA